MPIVPPVLGADVAVGDLLTVWNVVASLVGMFVVAVVLGRLLGTRRSPGAIVTSAVVGWLVGVVIAVLLAKNHDGEDAFDRNLWLFATFSTMSVTVWLEMLAKPGTFARAQTTLVGVPRPIHAVRRRAQRIGRYAQITRIAVRYGFGRSLGLSDDDEPDGAAEKRAPIPVRVRRALEDAGGVFVKLGQIMSTRADLLPPPMIDELSHLQDQVASVPRGDVEELLEDELGQPVERAFSAFDWDPIAAASIAQVYSAELEDGRGVIVKVQRPGIADAIDRDLGVIRQLGDTLEARAPWAAEYHVSELVTEFSERLREELDFRVEARNATEMAERLDPDGGVVIPKVDRELSSERVLVMERFDGVSVRDVAAIDAMGLDRRQLAERLLRSCLHQMLIDGHFHADPHPGNVLVLRDGTIGMIDLGATGRLDALEESSLRQIMFAVSQRDAALLRQAVLEMATVRRGFDDDQFERSLARFMARNLAPGVPPSAEMFNEMLQIFFSFGITLPPEFSTFFRAMITLEGTLRTLAPDFHVIDRAQAIAAEWGRDLLLPDDLGEMAKREVFKLAPLLRRLPRHVDRLATIAERGDLRARVSLFSVEDDVRVVTRLVNRVLLALLGGTVGVMSVILIGISGGPAFTRETSLYELLGYFGLFCGTVLIMRVLVSIFRDGLN